MENKLKWLEKCLISSFKPYMIGGDCAYAPTGEGFITYCSSGSKPEGKPTALFSTAEEAIDEFEKTVRDIIKTGKGTLCWRSRKTGKGTLYWRSRPRLFGSNLPESFD